MSGYIMCFSLRNSTDDHFKVDSALGERSVILCGNVILEILGKYGENFELVFWLN